MVFLIIILSIFFALNMGGASFAASFGAGYGGKIISRSKASILFILFVTLGAVLVGQNVSLTLGKNIIPSELIVQKALVVIFLAAGLSMFVSNLTKIPQSTSLVTVASIAGVGVYHSQVNIKTVCFLLPFWILLPILSYIITHWIAGSIYPPRKTNFWVYQKFLNHTGKLRSFVIIASCYNAFSVGTNNVANVVGPMISSGEVNILFALLFFAIVYGFGAFVFTGPIKTVGDRLVPLGLLTASIISLVSGTLMIAASIFGIPQSFVMLQLGSVFAISALKYGSETTFKNQLTRKMFYTWTINPVITFFTSWGLSWLIVR